MITVTFDEKVKIGLQYALEALHGCSPFGQEKIRINEEIAKKMSAEAEPAVTSNIEEPEPGPKGTVSEIKEREKRTAEQSLSELKALKEKFKNMSSEM